MKSIVKFSEIFALTSLLTIYSCSQNKQASEEIVTKDTAGNKVSDYEIQVRQSDETRIASQNQFNSESEAIKTKLENLKEKISQKGKKVNKDIAERIDRLDQERKEFKPEINEEGLKARWENFKTRVNAEVDSLDKRM